MIIARPLSKHEPLKSINSWQEWQEAWNETDNANIRCGLLFDLPALEMAGQDQEHERFVFLLHAAEGHSRMDLEENSWKVKGSKKLKPLELITPEMLDERVVVAQKAFKVLCQHFFHEYVQIGLGRNQNFLQWMRQNEQTAHIFFWFFRLNYYKYRKYELCNVTEVGCAQNNLTKKARGFLLLLCDKILTNGHDQTFELNAIEILAGLGELRLLLDMADCFITQKRIEKISQIICSSEHYRIPDPNKPGEEMYGKPRNIDDALKNKSKDAEVLSILLKRRDLQERK